MKKVFFKNLGERIGQSVVIKGFVRSLRKTKNVYFMVLADSTGEVQLTITDKERFSEFDLTIGTCVAVNGMVVANTSVKLNGLEVLPATISVLSSAEVYPIDENSKSDLRQDYRFLVLRESRNRAIFIVQTIAEEMMRTYWKNHQFMEIHSPKLLSAPSESGSELFELDYFYGHKAYLAQSPQFYKQMAMAAGFDKVFEIGPVFRANPSFTTRHDTEFTSVDVEMAWIDSHEDIMQLEEEWIVFILNGIKERCGELIMKEFGLSVEVPTLPFPRIPFNEALSIIASKGHILSEGDDIDSEGEKLLYVYVKEKYNHDFVFVTDYPISVRPFYHMRHEENPSLTKSYDLLWKGLEITTGAQREHRYEILKKQSEEKGLKLVDFYLEFFKYGCPPHGGYGFGLTRMLMILLSLPNVREATFLYRGPKRLTP
jgi:aspartyl-tRNA synthetase